MDMTRRGRQFQEKARRCCRGGQYADNVVGICGFATLPGAVVMKPGTSVIAPMPIAVTPSASRSPGLRSTRPSVC